MSYDVADVERLLVLMWDPAGGFGSKPEREPEPGMPRAKPDLSKSNTLYAELADIGRAWHRAELRQEERIALVLAFGLFWTARMAEAELGLPHSTVNYRKCRGVDKLVAFLNNREVEDDEEV